MQRAIRYNVELYSSVINKSEQTWAIIEEPDSRNRVEAIVETNSDKRGEASDVVAEDEIYLSNNFYF